MVTTGKDTGEASFELQVIGPTAIVRCYADIDRDHIDDLLKPLSSFSAKSHTPEIKTLAFDFQHKVEMEISALRKLAPTLKKLKGQGVTIFAVNGTTNLEAFLKKNGLDSLIRVFHGIQESASTASSDRAESEKMRSKLGPEHFSALIKGVVDIFKTQLGIDLTPTKPYPRPKSYIYTADVSGVSEICLEGNSGRIAICFSEALFLKVLQKMLKKDVSTFDPKLKDVAAEFLNITLGAARTTFVESGFVFSFDIPKAVFSREDKTPLTEDPSVILPFSCPEGDFQLEVSFPLGQ